MNLDEPGIPPGILMDEKARAIAEKSTIAAPRRPGIAESDQKALLAGGSLLGALAMTSCCIMPLTLFSLGVTSAWIGNLAALYPYRPIFFVITAGLLGAGFYKVYRKPKAAAGEAGGTCATSISDRVTKAALWSATTLALVALAFPYAMPLILE